jgi:hypothetical protein
MDEYQSLAHGWSSVASLEPYWIAFVAHVVCQRWQVIGSQEDPAMHKCLRTLPHHGD